MPLSVVVVVVVVVVIRTALSRVHTSAKAADVANLLLLNNCRDIPPNCNPNPTLPHNLADKTVVQLRPKSTTGSSFLLEYNRDFCKRV